MRVEVEATVMAASTSIILTIAEIMTAATIATQHRITQYGEYHLLVGMVILQH